MSNILENLYSFAETIVSYYATIMEYLSNTMVGDYSILECIIGIGLTTFISLTIAKWVTNFIP